MLVFLKTNHCGRSDERMQRNCVLIVPSVNPDAKLLPYLKDLVKNGFQKIILIDDGSRPECKATFDAAGAMPECDLLVHTVNMGKGRALKDALNYYCQHFRQDYSGVITVDSDGQHKAKDVTRLDAAICDCPETLVLGVRDFDGPTVPFKSRFGNKLTKTIMKLLIGKAEQTGGEQKEAIVDTQTGLRAIPNALILRYLTLNGERFEYETNMLIDALHSHTPVRQIEIDTVYVNENSETHFRPVADSFAIYHLIFATFFKYLLASLSAFLIDYSVYCLLIYALGALDLKTKIWISASAARVVSSLYNYTVNMAVVFQNHKGRKKTFFKYYALCAAQLCCCASFVYLICQGMGLSETIVKLVVDALLFIVSFQIQKNWVFREG